MQPGFKIEAEHIESKYRELQSLLHPDRYATASAQEKRLAVQGAALVNQAYAVLTDDCARAAYLLELKGIEFNDEPDTLNDAEFLMEQMELREALESSVDSADPAAALAQLDETAAARMAELTEHFKRTCIEGDFSMAREVVLKMKFIKKFRDEVRGMRRRGS